MLGGSIHAPLAAEEGGGRTHPLREASSDALSLLALKRRVGSSAAMGVGDIVCWTTVVDGEPCTIRSPHASPGSGPAAFRKGRNRNEDSRYHVMILPINIHVGECHVFTSLRRQLQYNAASSLPSEVLRTIIAAIKGIHLPARTDS